MGLLRVECDERNKIVRTLYVGVTTARDLQKGNSVVKKCLKSHGPCSGITDFSAVTKFNVSGAEMRALARLTPGIPANHLKVIVAPKDVTFGMSRMFQMLTDEARPNLRVVRTKSEAYKLLGATRPRFLEERSFTDPKPATG
jgi:hypothetical protein